MRFQSPTKNKHPNIAEEEYIGIDLDATNEQIILKILKQTKELT